MFLFRLKVFLKELFSFLLTCILILTAVNLIDIFSPIGSHNRRVEENNRAIKENERLLERYKSIKESKCLEGFLKPDLIDSK